jgi:hypothetical protein
MLLKTVSFSYPEVVILNTINYRRFNPYNGFNIANQAISVNKSFSNEHTITNLIIIDRRLFYKYRSYLNNFGIF